MKFWCPISVVILACSCLGSTPKEHSESITNELIEFRDKLAIGEFGPELVIVPIQHGKYENCIKEVVCENSITQIVGSMINRPYAISKYEITFNDYDLYTKDRKLSSAEDNGWGRGTRPVIFVAWNQALKYVEWLSEQSGFEYRLPTVVEWEYAARAGVRTAYWWGDKLGVNNANCKMCDSNWSEIQTAPVGSFPPNPWGIYDMHGNVSEFAQDCAMTNRKIRLSRRKSNEFTPDIKLNKNCKWARLKGGSWLTSEYSAFRKEYSSNNPAFPEKYETYRTHYGSSAIGIRVVRVL